MLPRVQAAVRPRVRMGGLRNSGEFMSVPQHLTDWLDRYLPPGVEAPRPLRLDPLSGDAGFRRYFRLACAPPVLATQAPPEHENNLGFVHKGLALARAGVRVPRVYAVDYRRGFLLQEDLGSQLMATALQAGDEERCYRQALATLAQIQATAPDPECFPAYDAAALEAELALFPRWFLGGLLGICPDPEARRLLAALFALLIDSAGQQPRVVVHRDYHSRNLLFDADGKLGVVDFQDAVRGPATYDLVSLLRDCYYRLDTTALDRHLAVYLEVAGVPAGERRRWRTWFDLMGLQRHIKVLGIFARLWLRDGKARYLDDLPLVIRYVLEVAGAHRETQEFADWFAAQVLPALGTCSWYRDWRTAGARCAP